MKWISVKEKLPESRNERTLIVGTTGLGERYVTVAEWNRAESGRGGWSFSRNDEMEGISDSSITHWMPLPLPPEN